MKAEKSGDCCMYSNIGCSVEADWLICKSIPVPTHDQYNVVHNTGTASEKAAQAGEGCPSPKNAKALAVAIMSDGKLLIMKSVTHTCKMYCSNHTAFRTCRPNHVSRYTTH